MLSFCKYDHKQAGMMFLGIITWCSVLPALWHVSEAQDLEDLEDEVEAFQEAAQSIYRFDTEAMETIRAAYCDEFDPGFGEKPVSEEDKKDFAKRAATEIGLDYQHQNDQWEELTAQVGPLVDALETLQENLETEARAEELLEIVIKEGGTLQDLGEDVVLRGANQPFVEFAINYGVQKHKDMCSMGESPRICDKTWPTLDNRRPDLVYVDSSGLWVLEFKPNNDRAISEGEKQVQDYIPGIESYFQNFFLEGRAGGYTSIPDSDHGGEDIVKKLLATDEAWTSDDEAIEAVGKVVTYDRCEEPD
jgi:hypothetical protein